MHFFIDENLPRSMVEEIEKLGHEAGHVLESELKGAEDPKIAEEARKRNAILITRDKEFGSSYHHPPEAHLGVIVIRLPNEYDSKQLNDRIVKFLENIEEREKIKDHVTILEIERFRMRELKSEND